MLLLDLRALRQRPDLVVGALALAKEYAQLHVLDDVAERVQAQFTRRLFDLYPINETTITIQFNK